MASGSVTPADPRTPAQEEAGEDVLGTAAAGPAAVRGGAIRLLSYGASSLIALTAGALLYRHLGPVRTGRYTTAISLAALVAGASDLGLTAIGIRELSARQGAERSAMVRTLLGLRLAVTALGVVAVTVFAFAAYDTTLGVGVLLAGVGLVFQVWQGTLALPLMASLRFGWTSALEFLRVLLMSVVIVALVAAQAGLLGFLAASIPAGVAVLGLTMLVLHGQVPSRPVFAPREWYALVKPVLSYAIAVAASVLYFRFAILIVSFVSGPRQLGYFSISFNVMVALFTIPAMLTTAAFPIFSRAAQEDHSRLAYGIERVFEVSLILGAWTSLAIALCATLAIEVIGGAKFAPAASILAIQGISIGATFVSTVWGFGLLSLGRHRAILIFSLLSLVAVVLVVTPLAAIDGARGAAIGTSAVEVGVAIGAGLLLTSGSRHLTPSLRVVPKVIAALVPAAAVALLPIPEIAQVLISGAVYLAVLLLLKALPEELLALVPRAGHRHA
jgi:O-antigen/teichoic acid export membrane protein